MWHHQCEHTLSILCRVSGNVVNDFVLGSITSAVQVYGVRLIVVLGHTRCGMVARAIQHWAKHEHKKAQDSLSAASNQVRPSAVTVSGRASSWCWAGHTIDSCMLVLCPAVAHPTSMTECTRLLTQGWRPVDTLSLNTKHVAYRLPQAWHCL